MIPSAIVAIIVIVLVFVVGAYIIKHSVLAQHSGIAMAILGGLCLLALLGVLFGWWGTPAIRMSALSYPLLA